MFRLAFNRLKYLNQLTRCGHTISNRTLLSPFGLKRDIAASVQFRAFSITSFQNNKSDSNDNGSNKNRKENNKEKEDTKDDDAQDKFKKMLIISSVWWTGVVVAFYIYQSRSIAVMKDMQSKQDATFNSNQQTDGSKKNARVPMSMIDLCHRMLAKGEVESIIVYPSNSRGENQENLVEVNLHPGAIIDNQVWPYRSFQIQVPDLDKFEAQLREFEQSIGISEENGVPILYSRNFGRLPELLFIGALVLLAVTLFRSRFRKDFKIDMKGGPQGFMGQFTKARFTLVDPLTRKETDAITFKDVAGLHEAKVEIMEFVEYLKNPSKFHKLGAKLPKGVLLLGPPGCGKTLLAKAVATEANVPFYALAGSDFVEMIGGVGAARVRDLFRRARKVSPCIVYIDEIDALGRKRSDGISGAQNSEGEQTLNQLLVEMDGMSTRQGVILLASTNRADVLDSALLRPGRFDRHIYLDYPNLQERKEIFIQHASKIKLKDQPSEYALRIAQLTPRMSGADLANVCNEAALNAARKDRKVVMKDDFEYAIERVVGGTEKRTNAITESEKRMIAFHECGHALVGWLLEHTDVLLKVSIIPRTTNILGFAVTLPSEQKLLSRDEIFDRMCMALGGRAAELIVFNHLSTGASNDLQAVTNMAMAQIKQYGLDPVIGHLSFPPQESNWMGVKGSAPYSKRLATTIDQRAQKLAAEAFQKTEALLRQNLTKLNLLAEELLKKEVLNYNDVVKLIGPPCGKKKKIAVKFLDIETSKEV